MKFDYKQVTNELLESVSERSKEIIERRFALGKKKPETLEKIGKDYGITRERIRQIESDGIKKIKKNLKKTENSNFKKIESFFLATLNKNSGLKREDLFLDLLGKKEDVNYIVFLLNLSDKCFRFKENDKIFAVWTDKKGIEKESKELVKEIKDFLKEKKTPLSLKVISEEFGVDKAEVKTHLETSKEISKTINGDNYGLVKWPEINPKTVRDKIYFILKDNKKPLHYKDIADNITRLNNEIVATSVSQKKLHPQTIHNELIRNEKFVLIGRGIYALKEWGYNDGQVKDVILEVLQLAKQPLAKERVIELVSEKRIVRESTILLNLQNKKLFKKDGSGKYNIRES
jgi:predicted Zn-ribbon and HTH transcriptional regulator